MKRCPYCAEEIQDEAIKCRFCGEHLKKKWWKGCLVGCLIILILWIVLILVVPLLIFLILKFIVYRAFFVQPHSSQYNYPLFTPPGLDYMLKDFGEFLKFFWGRLTEFFNAGRGRII